MLRVLDLGLGKYFVSCLSWNFNRQHDSNDTKIAALNKNHINRLDEMILDKSEAELKG